MTSFKNIKVELVDDIARVTMNRPEAMNALNKSTLEELFYTFNDFLKQVNAKGAIITGEGKAFVAGADISQMRELNVVQADEFCSYGHKTMNAIQNFSGPVIAAVNGFALGGGLELALSCDFIYASTKAKLGLPEVNLGLFPGFGGTQRLARVVGANRAKELIFTADMIDAEEAYRIGLANKICEPETLIEEAEKTIHKIYQKSLLAVGFAKRVVNEGSDLPLDSGLALERSQFPAVFATDDCKEGITAFLEKRKAEFKGR